jgi:predicted nucleic acid-binding Zn finger protein
MNKEEYVTKREALQKELADLKDEYVRTNSTLPNGTKVKVTNSLGETSYGIVEGYECFCDDVIPIVAKMKKNGTKYATAHVYAGIMSKIEVVE